MKLFNLVVLVAISFPCVAQPPQKVNSNYQFKSAGSDSGGYRLPKYTVMPASPTLNYVDSGAIAYRRDSTVWVWTGSQWVQIGTSAPPVTIGPIDSAIAAANGATAINNRIYMQLVKPTNNGLLDPLHFTHFENVYATFKNTAPGASNIVGYPDTATHATITGTDNVLYGRSAGASLSSGLLNTCIGSFAGSNLNAQCCNVAVGYTALQQDNAGQNNTAIGVQALRNSFSTANQTAIGAFALNACTSCDHNTAIGFNSLSQTTTGVGNTAVGNESNNVNTTGSYNTTMGWLSLARNTLGSFNTAIGYGANSGNGIANGNTSVGYLSMDLNIFGDGNASLGWESIANDTVPKFNTALGYGALRESAGDTLNTIVGYQAFGGPLERPLPPFRPIKNTIALGGNLLAYATRAVSASHFGCIYVGDSITQGANTDTIRQNTTLVGHNLTATRDNVANFGTASQAIQLGNGGGNTATTNSIITKAGDIRFNSDSNTYQMSDGSVVWNLTKSITGSAARTLTLASTITVPIGRTITGTYRVQCTQTAFSVELLPFYITNKTSTTFDIVIAGTVTGFVSFDWEVTQ